MKALGWLARPSKEFPVAIPPEIERTLQELPKIVDIVDIICQISINF